MKRRALLQYNHRGSILIVSLFILALLSLLGSAATTTSRTDVSISGNAKVLQESFYAAEAALTAGEIYVNKMIQRYELHESTIGGHYGQDEQARWDTLNWGYDDSIEVECEHLLGDNECEEPPAWFAKMASMPRYTIEEREFVSDTLVRGIGVPTGVFHFNVSAKGTGTSRKAMSVLRTIFAQRFN